MQQQRHHARRPEPRSSMRPTLWEGSHRCVSCRENWAANHLRKLDHRNHRRDPGHRLQPATETRQVTRERINIDLDGKDHAWIALTAQIVGATKTEVARAIIIYMRHHDAMTRNELQGIIKTQRLLANQKRARTQTDRRQAQRESAQSHQPE